MSPTLVYQVERQATATYTDIHCELILFTQIGQLLGNVSEDDFFLTLPISVWKTNLLVLTQGLILRHAPKVLKGQVLESVEFVLIRHEFTLVEAHRARCEIFRKLTFYLG